MDMRYKKNKEYASLQKRNRILGLSATWVLLVLGFLILAQSLNRPDRPLLDPRGTPNQGVGTNKPAVKLKVQEVMAAEHDWNTDLVGYFRFKGQQLGYDEYLITRLHGVMDCENGLHTAYRVNYLYDGENGHYTAAGFAMITKSTFNDPQFKCKGDRFNGVDNIDCFYKIYAKTALKRYSASKHCWGK